MYLNDSFRRNMAILSSRFPDIARLCMTVCTEDENARLRVVSSSSGKPTLCMDNLFFHSRYDPEREAERAISDASHFPATGCLFAGLALGWIPQLYAARHPASTIVIIEPDFHMIAACLSSRDLSGLLQHRELVLITGVDPHSAWQILEQIGMAHSPIHQHPVLTEHSRQWFVQFRSIGERNSQKEKINENTLKKFGGLWLKNMCKNLSHIRDRPGINSLSGIFSGLPVLMVAAGPTLDKVLNDIKEISRRMPVIAVDTAVRACLRAGVEPDIIVLVDPQYWNWRHLDGLSCTNSILVTESAAWPAVFRFECKDIFLCSSLFPLGKFIEERTDIKGELGAGGSVATSAWDLARLCGASAIYAAGLDLAFPGKQTHFSGSIFEERVHSASSRTNPAETSGWNALRSAGPYFAKNYRGENVLTDKRLHLYSWWFESKISRYPETSTYTLCADSLHIPGILPAQVEEVLIHYAPCRDDIRLRLSQTSGKSARTDKRTFKKALDTLRHELQSLEELAERALEHSERNEFERLDQLDRLIMNHPAKDIAAMLFTAEKTKDPKAASMAVYRAIMKSVRYNRELLEKYQPND